jgi:hypothetical protein
MTEGPAPGKPLSIGEQVIITGRVAWADRDDVLIDLDGCPLRIPRVKLGLQFVRRMSEVGNE